MGILGIICSLFKKSKKKQEVDFKRRNKKRLKKEFEQLKKLNPELYQLVTELSHYTQTEFGKNIVITMIYRSQKQQWEIYGKDYKKKSPHMFWQSVDIRSKTFTKDEIDNIVEYLNSYYNQGNWYDWTAKCHTVGDGAEHFHIQLYIQK
jgi:uncharacterized protein YcbK (DUF882 family)